MDIHDIIEKHPEISITVTAQDLQEFGQNVAAKTAAAILEKSEDKLFTRQEVIRQLGVSSATLWRWDRLGILKAKRIGNKVFYSGNSLREHTKEK